MSSHHAQAVEMAEIIRGVTADGQLELMATDIALTQQSQIGQMRGWLQQWELSVGAPPRSLDWMGMDHDGAMPGMATDEQVRELFVLPVAEAEERFLELMIEHHRGGVAMAEGVLGRTDRAEVRRFARAIVQSQQAEIETMQDMLEARGRRLPDDATPSVEGGDDHSGH